MAFLRKSLIDIRGGETDDGPTYTLVYLVKTDVACGPFAVRGYVGWSFGDVYSILGETDILARVTNMTEEPIGTSRLDWKSTIEFTRGQSSSPTGGDPAENPLLEPVGIDWDYEGREVNSRRDASGNWIKNSAGELFDEYIPFEDFRRVLTVTRNEARFPRALADSLSNKVNASPWNGYAAKSVRLCPIRTRRAFHQTIGLYWQTTYEFHIARIGDTWQRIIADTGLNELISGNLVRAVIDGEYVVKPIALNGSGRWAGAGVSPSSITVDMYASANFSLLNLDSIL